MTYILSPLRYPGGKSKSLKKIRPFLKNSFTEYREPLVGGGSVFLEIKQKRFSTTTIFIINDLYYDLYCFWNQLKNNPDNLISEIREIKKTRHDGKELYKELRDNNKKITEYERALRYYILNRITYSGTVDSGGYSQESFEKRFTHSCIQRLRPVSNLLDNVIIQNLDYSKILSKKGSDVFIYLDPPYYKYKNSKLYGNKGHLHTSFDHERFAKTIKICKHKWLITYDDSEKIRSLFNFANKYIYENEIQYYMSNVKGNTPKKGRELFITNYEVFNHPKKYKTSKLTYTLIPVREKK